MLDLENKGWGRLWAVSTRNPWFTRHPRPPSRHIMPPYVENVKSRNCPRNSIATKLLQVTIRCNKKNHIWKHNFNRHLHPIRRNSNQCVRRILWRNYWQQIDRAGRAPWTMPSETEVSVCHVGDISWYTISLLKGKYFVVYIRLLMKINWAFDGKKWFQPRIRPWHPQEILFLNKKGETKSKYNHDIEPDFQNFLKWIMLNTLHQAVLDSFLIFDDSAPAPKRLLMSSYSFRRLMNTGDGAMKETMDLKPYWLRSQSSTQVAYITR